MELTAAQKRSLVDDGYVHVADVVPRAMVDAALRGINAELDEGMPPEMMGKYRSESYCPKLRGQAVITDLFGRSPAIQLAESALGGAGTIKRPGQGQVALRFPTMDEKPAEAKPHIDGMVTPGTIYSFTALLAVLLSDLPGPNAGNFTVWPGSHLQHAQYLKEHTPQALLKGMPRVSYGQKRQIMGKAGDVVLAHYLLGHGVAANRSPHIRYAVFFRLERVDHVAPRWEAMSDPWLEWPGVR